MNLSRFNVFKPRSLLSRTLLLTILAVFLAQGIATVFWFTQTEKRELEGLVSVSQDMAEMFASTTKYFQTLPLQYRQIALDQLRNMGGARFFVSFNQEELYIQPTKNSKAKELALTTIKTGLIQILPNTTEIRVEFSNPTELRVLNNDLRITDLPKSWAHHTLSISPLTVEILVVQIKLKDGQWIYLAATLPGPYSRLESEFINADQFVFLISITTLLIIFIFTLIRNQTRPLKRLAEAANRLSTDIEQQPLVEEGPSEITTVTRAFNVMQQRLQRYMQDREKLFGSISHDLKTPITRLRLRAELIDDEIQAEKINKDLDELEIMVKGALQTVKDTDIHENIAQIDVKQILNSIAEIHNIQNERVDIRCPDIHDFYCKPLAFKRCLTNLIDNGVQYGGHVLVQVYNSDNSLDITLIDQGPGIPEEHLSRVFDPYFRLHTDTYGTGLGLGIAKNIIHAHGGEIIISNHNRGGLQIDIALPKV